MRFDDLRIDACVLGFPILQPANAGHEGVEDSSNDICIAFEKCPGLSRKHLGAQHACNSASGLGMSSGIVPIANKYRGLGGHMAFKWYRLCVLHCTCGVTLGTRGKHVHMMQKMICSPVCAKQEVAQESRAEPCKQEFWGQLLKTRVEGPLGCSVRRAAAGSGHFCAWHVLATTLACSTFKTQTRWRTRFDFPR